MTATLRRLLELAPASRPRLALSVGLGALTVLFGVGLMATAGYLISRAAEQPAILSLTTVIVAVRVFALGRPLARYVERLVSHDLAFRVLGRLRARFYERIEPLAPAEVATYRSGDLLSRMVADVDSLQNLHLRVVSPALVALVAGVLAVAAAAAILPAAALVLGLGLAASALVVPLAAAATARRTGAQEATARGELAAELVESLGAASEIAVYGREEDRLDRIRRVDQALVEAGRRHALAGGLGDALVLLLTGITVTGVLTVAVSAHANGSLDRTLVAALALLALASFEAVQPLSAGARDAAATLAAGRRIVELVDRKPSIRDPATPSSPPAGAAVAIEDLRARYGPDESPVLEGAHLRLDPGRRVALVGASGAGKTTVVNLLLRFLDPERGHITLDGRDLREYRQEDVRRSIAVAGQGSHVFSTSIHENVRLGRPEAGDTEIEEALRQARLWPWIETLPEGWHTRVGEQGRELSGGQRQRLVLARALLARAPVLVLDEPTAHLDHETAEALMEDVLSAAHDRSVLLLTHRPEGLDLVDEVLVLDGGQIEPVAGRG